MYTPIECVFVYVFTCVFGRFWLSSVAALPQNYFLFASIFFLTFSLPQYYFLSTRILGCTHLLCYFFSHQNTRMFTSIVCVFVCVFVCVSGRFWSSSMTTSNFCFFMTILECTHWLCVCLCVCSCVCVCVSDRRRWPPLISFFHKNIWEYTPIVCVRVCLFVWACRRFWSSTVTALHLIYFFHKNIRICTPIVCVRVYVFMCVYRRLWSSSETTLPLISFFHKIYIYIY